MSLLVVFDTTDPVPVKLAGADGSHQTVPGFIVPQSSEMLAVVRCPASRRWQLAHVATGRVIWLGDDRVDDEANLLAFHLGGRLAKIFERKNLSLNDTDLSRLAPRVDAAMVEIWSGPEFDQSTCRPLP